MDLEVQANEQNVGPEEQAAFVRFTNRTHRDVDLYWLDQSSNGITPKLYLVLRPNGEVNVNTYCTHPWIFRDSKTGELMHIKHKKIFWPVAVNARNPRNFSEIISVRIQMFITLPLRSLRDRCIWYMAKRLHKSKANAQQVIEPLCIPQTLKDDIYAALDFIRNYRPSTVLRRLNVMRR